MKYIDADRKNTASLIIHHLWKWSGINPHFFHRFGRCVDFLPIPRSERTTYFYTHGLWIFQECYVVNLPWNSFRDNAFYYAYGEMDSCRLPALRIDPACENSRIEQINKQQNGTTTTIAANPEEILALALFVCAMLGIHAVVERLNVEHVFLFGYNSI